MVSNKLGILIDNSFFLHDTGAWHPESPERLRAIEEAIDSIKIPYTKIKARLATRDELLLIHKPQYVDYILNSQTANSIQLDPDTLLSLHSKEAALMAVGGTIEAVNMVIDGTIDRAFCAVRPPGHHARSGAAMGFCIFNNVAIAAAYALAKKSIERAAIIDWDVHHGNGTAESFYRNPNVLYISMHQYPYYPGTGSEVEQGEGEGLGFTLNIPMPAGSNDDDYRKAFKTKILPELQKFAPDIVFISAGFDAHEDDPLGGIKLSTEFFGEMTRIVCDIADKYSKCRLVSVLEGGYNLNALRDSVKVHLEELAK